MIFISAYIEFSDFRNREKNDERYDTENNEGDESNHMKPEAFVCPNSSVTSSCEAFVIGISNVLGSIIYDEVGEFARLILHLASDFRNARCLPSKANFEASIPGPLAVVFNDHGFVGLLDV